MKGSPVNWHEQAERYRHLRDGLKDRQTGYNATIEEIRRLALAKPLEPKGPGRRIYLGQGATATVHGDPDAKTLEALEALAEAGRAMARQKAAPIGEHVRASLLEQAMGCEGLIRQFISHHCCDPLDVVLIQEATDKGVRFRVDFWTCDECGYRRRLVGERSDVDCNKCGRKRTP